MGTPLVGIFFSKIYKLIDKGRFWLNEEPDSIPQNIDRGETDKGFGNINTYKAVLWVKIQTDNSKELFIFNSHYPFSGNNKTRRDHKRLVTYLQKLSFCHHGAFNPITNELVPLSGSLNEEQNEGRYFSSDHALIGADFFLS